MDNEMTMRRGMPFAAIGGLLGMLLGIAGPVAAAEATHGPLLRWDFPAVEAEAGPALEAAPGLSLDLVGAAAVRPSGPTGEDFEGLPASNGALELDGRGSYARMVDPGPEGPLRFGQGDPITLEAWVRIDSLGGGANVYLIGKGRTYRDGRRENQNYALRLRGVGGEARASFLFSTAAESDSEDAAAESAPPQYHRWTSDRGFPPDGGWHHVAISYRFGEPESIRGYVDGAESKGRWDMAGPTDQPPIVDDDELWLGSACGGNAGNSLRGALDRVALHRRLVTPAEIAARRIVIERPPQRLVAERLAEGVVVQIAEGVASYQSWPSTRPPVLIEYTQEAMAFPQIPIAYGPGGVRSDWDQQILVTAQTRYRLPEGEVELLLRAPGLSRLWIDDEVVASTPPHKRFANGHGRVVPYESDDAWLRPPRPGDIERRVTIQSDGQPRWIVLEQILGAPDLRFEPGETTVAFRAAGETSFQVVSAASPFPLTDAAWDDHAQRLRTELAAIDDSRRRAAAASEQDYWDARHALARRALDRLPPVVVPSTTHSASNWIDQHLGAALEAAGIEPAPRTDDLTFLRRIYLDTIGLLPTVEEIDAFLAEDAEERRAWVIDRLLADERWADHWTSYWQDVLAENPSLVKPTLNNTGPFRWFIYDAMRDNLPLDRFVTELIRMRGSVHFGGPAGFGLASQNDVPMAAKAHVLGAAFLGVEMKCARCHDAPYHEWKQEDLFSIAAMLEEEPLKVPATSSVPGEFLEDGRALIEVTLQPGEEVPPRWPLESLVAASGLPEEMIGDSPREQLAAWITGPDNSRFAQVLANRLWKRLMGEGLVETVDDWEGARPSHPELLEQLGRQLIADGYDFKQLARRIFNSHAYQRQAEDRPVTRQSDQRHFAAPRLRRATAEQLVDSLHAAVGLELPGEELTFDPEAQQRARDFMNLGQPRRAWQLASLSNERDRPSLSLPEASAIVECLEAFGWRGTRAEPISHRDTEPNVVQGGQLANGILSVRLTRLSDDAPLTQWCLDAESPEELVRRLYLQLLTRQPTAEELSAMAELLREGFATRRVDDDQLPAAAPPQREPAVSWANHLSSEANYVMLRIERRVHAGPEPTARLEDDWRQRAEDVVWALINTPEQQFLP